MLRAHSRNLAAFLCPQCRAQRVAGTLLTRWTNSIMKTNAGEGIGVEPEYRLIFSRCHKSQLRGSGLLSQHRGEASDFLF